MNGVEAAMKISRSRARDVEKCACAYVRGRVSRGDPVEEHVPRQVRAGVGEGEAQRFPSASAIMAAKIRCSVQRL